ncbi:hypothetical protein HUK80_13085 [Flavobacterium sp. MAH-1]|uniref:DUF4157 domain-containing protein n=1 Tax=Flavobacterium agri TaxID=2743471 RepID=A0A7Y8Y3C2_9FLAO|nr:hypothetical protein [Flavobacterium agri]NUY81835.1 hypothetical protein [Flavobacterium agri]NYA71859.1 hypothetical protein [Flavobacterium agri]
MIVIVAKYLIPKGFVGLTLFPFVLLGSEKGRDNAVLLNHERIHLFQQRELLVLPFFLWYGFEYLLRLIQYRDRKLAYRNICFEREAYANEKSPDYLKSRALWKFISYL